MTKLNAQPQRQPSTGLGLLAILGLIGICSCVEISGADSNMDSRTQGESETDTNTEITSDLDTNFEDSESDGCPNDPNKTEPGECGCGTPDVDGDADGVADCQDHCPTNPTKVTPGVCGCSISDADGDKDGAVDCQESCPNDPAKTQPGMCGCGVPEGTCEIVPEDLVGDYERLPVENDWHKVNVTFESGALKWNNAAGTQWLLNLADGLLTTGSDCPYGVVSVAIETEAGTNTVTGLLFNAELYQKL